MMISFKRSLPVNFGCCCGNIQTKLSWKIRIGKILKFSRQEQTGCGQEISDILVKDYLL